MLLFLLFFCFAMFEANLTRHGISFKHDQPRSQGQLQGMEFPVFVTCRPGECGGRTCFARWTSKFVSRIVVVSCWWDSAFKFVLNKNLKVFFGLLKSNLGTFFLGVISLIQMQMNSFRPERRKRRRENSKELCLQTECE